MSNQAIPWDKQKAPRQRPSTPIVPRDSTQTGDEKRAQQEAAQRSTRCAGRKLSVARPAGRFHGSTVDGKGRSKDKSLSESSGDGQKRREEKRKKLKALLWQRYGGKELIWDPVAVRMIGGGLALRIDGLGDEIKSNLGHEPKGDDWKEILDELKDFIPIGRTGVAGFKLFKEIASTFGHLNERRVTRNFEDRERRSPMEGIALEGMLEIIQIELNKNYVKAGIYTFEAVASIVDFTSLSALGTKAAHLGKDLYDLYHLKRMFNEANAALASEETVTPELFADVPILACTMMHDMHEAELIGLCNAVPTEEMTRAEQDEMVSRFHARDRHAIETYAAEVAEVKWLAQHRVETAPFALWKELERRKFEGFKDYGVARLPGKINPHKPKAPEKPLPLPRAHYGDLTREDIVRRARRKREEEKKRRAPGLTPRRPPPGGEGNGKKKGKKKGSSWKSDTGTPTGPEWEEPPPPPPSSGSSSSSSSSSGKTRSKRP